MPKKPSQSKKTPSKKPAPENAETRPMPQVVLTDHDGGDWQGLYIDGVLVHEDHTIQAGTVLEMVLDKLGLKITFEKTWLSGTASTHLENVGRLPQTLAELDEWIKASERGEDPK